LKWSVKNGIRKSSLIFLIPTYKGALVMMGRQLDCNVCSFWTWLQAADLHVGQLRVDFAWYNTSVCYERLCNVTLNSFIGRAFYISLPFSDVVM
jgi:hypothetical protein